MIVLLITKTTKNLSFFMELSNILRKYRTTFGAAKRQTGGSKIPQNFTVQVSISRGLMKLTS